MFSKYFPDVRELLRSLTDGGVLLGLVSDNKPDPIFNALRLWEIDHFFDEDLMCVELYDGYCPKVDIITKAISGLGEGKLPTSKERVLLIDDHDYSKEAQVAGIVFRKRDNNSDLASLVL